MSTLWSAEGAEVPLVEREDAVRAIATGQHDDRGVCEPDSEVAVRRDDIAGLGGIALVERREVVPAGRDLVEERKLRLDADAGCDEVVELGEDERGEDERARFRVEHPASRLMLLLSSVERLEESACVEQNQSWPKPRIASSQSVIGLPLSKSGNFGRGRTCSVV